ncbi:MAG TPA: RNA polymerase sigma-70 factor [Bacteroidales bacterium]
MSFTDLELLSRIKKSDEKAFETLFRAYYKSLCLFAYKILKDNVTAEEIVQDIFYYVWEKREDLELTTSVKSYLFKSVYNNSLKNIRHQKIVKNYEAKAIIEGPSFELQENYAEIGEMMHVIQLTLEQVPERTREIFELNRNEGLKYQEISEKLNISIKTVEAHMTSILKQFRENLKDYMILLLLFLIGYLP